MDKTRHRLSRDGAVALKLGGHRTHELASVAHTVVGVSLDLPLPEAFRVGADRLLGVSKGKRSTRTVPLLLRRKCVSDRVELQSDVAVDKNELDLPPGACKGEQFSPDLVLNDSCL